MSSSSRVKQQGKRSLLYKLLVNDILDNMDQSKILRRIKILASIGVLLAIYLVWQQFARPSFTPCSINAQVNCDAVISGPLAKTFGIPTPLIGLTGYIIILVAAFLGSRKIILAMSTFGLVFCLWLGYVEIFQLHVLCPVCIICQLVMITVWISAIQLLQKGNDNT